jgi:uncharacterized membrane protein
MRFILLMECRWRGRRIVRHCVKTQIRKRCVIGYNVSLYRGLAGASGAFMHASAVTHTYSARALLACVWGFVCLLTLAAPMLLARSCVCTASILYLTFSRFCHQIPDRSFFLLGHPLAVCHRCFGLYLGFFFGSFIQFPFLYRSLLSRRLCVASACLPVLLDVFLSRCGLWHSTGTSRFLMGLFSGCLLSPLLAQGMAEILRKTPRRSLDYATCESREAYHE